MVAKLLPGQRKTEYIILGQSPGLGSDAIFKDPFGELCLILRWLCAAAVRLLFLLVGASFDITQMGRKLM